MESGRRILVSRPHSRRSRRSPQSIVKRSYVGMACHRALVERYFLAIPSAIPAAMGNLKSSCRYALIMRSIQSTKPTKPISMERAAHKPKPSRPLKPTIIPTPMRKTVRAPNTTIDCAAWNRRTGSPQCIPTRAIRPRSPRAHHWKVLRVLSQYSGSHHISDRTPPRLALRRTLCKTALKSSR